MQKLKNWRGVGAYVFLIFLTSPLLPNLIKSLASLLGLSPSQLLSYVKVIILTGLSFSLPLYIYMSGQHRDKKCWGILFVVALGAAVLVVNLGSSADSVHLLEYGGLGVAVFYTMTKEYKKPFPQVLYLKAALFTLVVGVIDEIYQGYLPNRVYDFNDIVINTASGILGLLFLWGVVRPHEEINLSVDNTH